MSEVELPRSCCESVMAARGHRDGMRQYSVEGGQLRGKFQDAEVAVDALVSLGEDTSSSSSRKDPERPDRKARGATSLRPSRRPPSPPKRRSVSDNVLIDLHSGLENLQLNTEPSVGSSSPSSTFYIGPSADTPQTKSNVVRNSMDTSSQYVVKNSDGKTKSMKRPTRSYSVFHVDSPETENPSQPITAQPMSTNAGGSSFYAIPPTGNMNPEKLSFGREQIMQVCMAKRQDEYTVKQPFKVFTGTWNVNGQIPPSEVKDWLSTDTLLKDPPDIYFIAFQELDLSKEAYVFSDSLREDEWKDVVAESLPSEGVKYHLLKSVRLIGMMLLVYVKTLHVLSVRDVSCHQVGTGILGRLGNKGGVGVHLAIHNTSICAVNSHLAAHMEQCSRRNEDFKDICSRLRFPVLGQPPLGVFQHDIVLWLGDLNYRIQDKDIPPEHVKQLIEEGGYKLLREYDQLLVEKTAGRVFRGFSEGELNFRPTYKYNPGTNHWDTSDKCRTPAWCDRILWWERTMNRDTLSKDKSQPAVELIEYTQHMSLTISDHKPVSALFNMKVKVIDEVQYKRVFEDENRRLDKLENEYLPSMKLDVQHVDFGEVKFQQPKLCTVDIDNNGMVPCSFEFISKPGEPNVCKKWLTIATPSGCLFPGEKYTLEFEVYVNRITAPFLNSGKEKLEDILILHLVGGKDFFITVNGIYLPSCFGTSIEALCRLRRPIRCCTPEEVERLSKIQPNRLADLEGDSTLAIPKELWTLVDHLFINAKTQEELFQQPGLHTEVENIRDCLDSKIDVGGKRTRLPGSNHSVAEALLILLEALPEPVVPFHLYEACLEVCEIFQTCKQILHGMSQHHRNVFKYVTAFLRELLRYSNENGLDLELVTSIFSGLMLRPSPAVRKEPMDSRLDREKAKKFLLHFLKNSYDE